MTEWFWNFNNSLFELSAQQSSHKNSLSLSLICAFLSLPVCLRSMYTLIVVTCPFQNRKLILSHPQLFIYLGSVFPKIIYVYNLISVFEKKTPRFHQFCWWFIARFGDVKFIIWLHPHTHTNTRIESKTYEREIFIAIANAYTCKFTANYVPHELKQLKHKAIRIRLTNIFHSFVRWLSDLKHAIQAIE